jgi:hypothetical protein
MYQSLIWSFVLRNDPGRLCAPLYPENRKRLADPLVDGVGRNLELGGDFFRGEKLVDEPQTIQLTGAQSRNTRCHFVGCVRARCVTRRIMRFVRMIQYDTHPAQHAVFSEQRFPRCIKSSVRVSPVFP